MRAFIIALLLVPGVAGAEAWSGCPGSTANTTDGSGIVVMSSGVALCYRSNDTGVVDPPRVIASDCDGVDLLYNADVNGTDTDALLQAYRCASADDDSRDASGAAVLTDCEKILTDTDADGSVNDTTLNGSVTAHRDAIYGITQDYLGFDITSNADPDTYEIKLVCK